LKVAAVSFGKKKITFLYFKFKMAKVYKSHAKLFNENYTYRYNCKCKNTVYYICVISGCTGRAAVYDSGFIKVTKEHDCIPSVIDQSVIKVKEKLKLLFRCLKGLPFKGVFFTFANHCGENI